MPTIPKPKFGWKNYGFSQSARKYFIDQAFQKIETTLDVPKISEAIREEIIKAAQNYFDTNNQLVDMPRISNVRAALIKVQKETKSLIPLLKNLDSKTKDVLTSTDHDLFALFNNGQSDIYKLNSAATAALKSLPPDRRGPSISRRDLKGLILDLREIFFKATGKRASRPTENHDTGKFGGKFFNFVDVCLKIIDREIINTTLAFQIQATFKLPFMK